MQSISGANNPDQESKTAPRQRLLRPYATVGCGGRHFNISDENCGRLGAYFWNPPDFYWAGQVIRRYALAWSHRYIRADLPHSPVILTCINMCTARRTAQRRIAA